MIDNEALQDLQTIKQVALQNWGSNCEFADIKVANSPHSEFELSICLYHEIEVGIYYDRSALDIGIRRGGKYDLLGTFTTKQVFRGMKAMKPENLLCNFKVLDEVARGLIAGRHG